MGMPPGPDAGLRRTKQFGVDYMLSNGPRIPRDEAQLRAVMLIKYKYTRLIHPERPRARDYDRDRGPIRGYPDGGSYAAFAYNVGYTRAMMPAVLTA